MMLPPLHYVLLWGCCTQVDEQGEFVDSVLDQTTFYDFLWLSLKSNFPLASLPQMSNVF